MTNLTDANGEYPLKGLRLLLCDDEMRLRQIVTLMAEELGATVVAVDSCEEAVKRYKEEADSFDVLLLDLRMNGMGGEAAYREIKSFNSAARVVISSGVRPDDEFVDQLEKVGDGFIEKPFDMDGLAKTLSQVGRRY